MYREKLLRKVEALDVKQHALLKELKAYDEEALFHKQAEEVWSPVQILQHILLAEKLSLAYCLKKLSFQPELKQRSPRTWMNDKLVQAALLSPFKFKAPRVVAGEHLSNSESIQEIQEKWSGIRKEIRSFIEGVSDDYLEAEVYKHPFGLRMSLGGMLDFHSAHFARHKKQLMKRLRS